MNISDFLTAIKQLADEKGLSESIILEAVEAALAAAYRKDYGHQGQVIKVKLDPEKNQMKVWRVYTVIDDEEELTNKEAQLMVDEAQRLKKGAKAGDSIELPLEVKSDFGRVAAQTAKQVIIQRLREAERDVLYEEFKSKEKKIINGVVQRVEGPNVIVDLGKINGIMIPSDQMPSERYYTGQRIKVYVSEVEETNKGPRILVSRSRAEFIVGLFSQEVPEIESGSIEISGIAREAGSRTKIAVKSNDVNLDPVGSVVGQRGTRVQSVLSEIPNEKIDIILYSEDPQEYIENALSPAEIDKVKFNKKERSVRIWVQDDQLSLAIGKSGQNVRLASKLTGWSIDIVKDEVKEEPKEESKSKKEVVEEDAVLEPQKVDKESKKEELEEQTKEEENKTEE